MKQDDYGNTVSDFPPLKPGEISVPIEGSGIPADTLMMSPRARNMLMMMAAFGGLGHKALRPRRYVSTYEHVLRIKYPVSADAIIASARVRMEDGEFDRYDHALKAAEESW